MKPKEKAIELLKLHKQILLRLEFEISCFYIDEIAKQCALIAVDEILNNDGFTQFDQYLTQYWQEVKTEIEKL